MTNDEQNRLAKDLGDSLRRARTSAGLTQSELAERAGWTEGTAKTKASKIENGRQLPSAEDIDAWAAATGAPDRVRDQWKDLTVKAGAERSAGYDRRMAAGQEKVQKEYTDLAETTSSFRFFEIFAIPRYLQVPAYTRAVLEEYRDKVGVINDVDAAAKERQRSTRFLYDPDKEFRFLINEPVLRGTRFPASIMRAQLHHLLSSIGLDGVTIAIYPSLSRPVNTLAESSFELFDDIGFVETVLEDDKRLLAGDVIRLEALFERYWADAVVDEEARPLLLEIIASLPAD